MKYFKLVSVVTFLLICTNVKSQTWGGFPIKQVIDNSVLIFEGKVLSDSFYLQNPPGEVATYHRVLVTKQFKGQFKSDTLIVVNFGGQISMNGYVNGENPAYVKRGDEAVFFVNTYWSKNKIDPEFYFIGYGDGCGFVKVCDKKDVVKEVYEPIEKATGTPRIVLRKNSCEK